MEKIHRVSLGHLQIKSSVMCFLSAVSCMATSLNDSCFPTAVD